MKYFIDLFAGIGGFRLALESLGCKCVFSSEWNKYCQQTYFANFGEQPSGDITKIGEELIPDHDILCAGFPCQPFSIAGVTKHNALGNKHGFAHPTQGTLFFDIVRIIKKKRPAAFILENVKNLRNHDRGRTFEIILNTLESELRYDVHDILIDAKLVVPQHRERVFIIGFREARIFNLLPFTNMKPRVRDILERTVSDKYTLSDHLWSYLRNYAEKHRKKGNGFGFGLADLDGIARTLSARYYKDGAEILIPQSKKNPRRLTPRECARLMGYPDSFKIPVSDAQAYRQFGNSVVVPVVRRVAESVLYALDLTPIKKETMEQTSLYL